VPDKRDCFARTTPKATGLMASKCEGLGNTWTWTVCSEYCKVEVATKVEVQYEIPFMQCESPAIAAHRGD
jgi:hypothetical protein